MPLRNLVFVDSVVSSYPIRPSPRRCLTGRLQGGSLLIEIPDCLKPYFSAIGSIESAVPPDASSQASGVNDLWYFFCTRFDAISRFPTLFSPDALQARSSDRFVAYNSRTDSSVLPLCPPCRITSNRSAQFLASCFFLTRGSPTLLRSAYQPPESSQHPRAQPQIRGTAAG